VGPALLATAGIAFASPLSYYGAWLLSYGHAPAAFAVALFVERWDGTRTGPHARHPLRWALLGALLGLAMLMRPQNAVFVFAPLGEWLYLAFQICARRSTGALSTWWAQGCCSRVACCWRSRRSCTPGR
jgi:hypothetical protein